jgi:NAD(P)-dependent dehydrogenase (short-subunit alcohol dehydrogenase family)
VAPRVVVHGRDAGRGSAVVDTITAEAGKAHFVAVDLTDPAQVDQLVDQAGPVDVLVNNAGFSWFGPTAEIDVATFDRLFATNVRAPYLPGRRPAAEDGRPGQRQIINIASMAGRSAYGATKATLASMTRSWTADLRDAGRHPGGPALHPHADPEGS